MKIKNIIIFGLGVSVGALITNKLVSDKYEDILEKEIDSVKRAFGRGRTTISSDDIIEENTDEEKENDKSIVGVPPNEKKEYNTIIDYNKYSGSETVIEDDINVIDITNVGPSDDDVDDGIYVVSPNEFAVLDDYEVTTLTYYADGTLTDDNDDIIYDVDGILPNDYASHFGEYEEDSVYVRNTLRKTDYEILKDVREYSDAVWRPPHMEV